MRSSQGCDSLSSLKDMANNRETISMTQLSNRKTETFSIGDKTFISPSWPPLSKAAKNLPIIGKSFAVPISFLMSAGVDGDLGSAIPQALFMLFEQLEEEDISKLFNIVLEDVWCKTTDKKVNLDDDFNNLDELLTLVSLVLKQHYGCLMSGKGFQSLFQMMVPLAQGQME